MLRAGRNWRLRAVMLDLRDLECLSALARHKHFARAAEDCGMSQPAFSMRIRNLEERLETQIVRRGNRFQGLTAEGELVLAHGRAILESTRTLEERVRAVKGEVIGQLHLGVIPTANAFAGQVTVWLREVHPGIKVETDTATSLALLQGLEDGRYDAALTYTDGVATSVLQVEPLYDERYVLMLSEKLGAHSNGEIGWREAAEYPLILLESDMQNRRIIDRIFAEVGAEVDVVGETDGFTAMIAMAIEGMGAAVLPRVLVDRLGTYSGVSFLPLVNPLVERSVGLLLPHRPQLRPAVQALLEIVRRKSGQ